MARLFSAARRRVLLALLALGLVVAGCGGSPVADDDPGYTPAYVATALTQQVQIFDTPDGKQTNTLRNPDVYGQPLTFLELDQQQDWVKVALPVRPNGSSGWVRTSQVRLQLTPYRLDVRLKSHDLKVYKDGGLEYDFPIGVGKAETPTPGGTYYLRVLIKTTNPSGAYGPYAYGLNGFSPVLNDFAGGDGVIGLHGTNDPATVGTDVSHGCIRLHNEDITTLAKELPLGTPVRILNE